MLFTFSVVNVAYLIELYAWAGVVGYGAAEQTAFKQMYWSATKLKSKFNMAEKLIEKIISEVSATYATVNQYGPDNNFELRSKLRKAVQTKLQPYVTDKLIDSFAVVCDESNNNTRDVKQAVKLDVIVQVSKSTPRYIIALPSQKSDQRNAKTANGRSSLWNQSKIGADSLWAKLFRKRSG